MGTLQKQQMYKRTLYFGNPYHLCIKNANIWVQSKKDETSKSIALEDVGFIVLDNEQITVSQKFIQLLTKNNCAVLWCNEQHMPSSLLLPLDNHHIQHERFKQQISVKKPFKKQLWAQVVKAKIKNQSELLGIEGYNNAPLNKWAKNVLSGDSSNREALSARYYWKYIFSNELDYFTRERFGEMPNNALNYGYAILRAVIARSLVAAGLLPTLGIHHSNKYNAFCLADDIMEPFRPFVDQIVLNMLSNYIPEILGVNEKAELLKIPQTPVLLKKEKKPLMNAAQDVAFQLVNAFSKKSKKLTFPKFIFNA